MDERSFDRKRRKTEGLSLAAVVAGVLIGNGTNLVYEQKRAIENKESIVELRPMHNVADRTYWALYGVSGALMFGGLGCLYFGHKDLKKRYSREKEEGIADNG